MKLRKKTISLTKLLIIGFITIAIASVFVFNIEALVTEGEKKEEIFQKLSSLKSSYVTSEIDFSESAKEYDAMFEEEAELLVYMHDNVDGFEVSDRLQNATYLTTIVVNPSDVTDPEKHYTSSQCKDGTVYALDFSGAGSEFIYNSLSWSSYAIVQEILSQNDLILITSKDGSIQFNPADTSLEGKNVSELGFEISDIALEDTVYLKINDEKYYTASSVDEQTGLIFIYAVKSHVFNANNRICAILICAAMFIIITMIITYCYFSRQEDIALQKGEDGSDGAPKSKNPIIIGFVGLLGITIITFYIQSLFCLSVFSMTKNNETLKIETAVSKQIDRLNTTSMVNNYVNMEKSSFLNVLLAEYPELHSRDRLMDLQSILKLPYIHIYDSSMNEVVTTDDYKNQYENYANTPIFSEDIEYAISEDQKKVLVGNITRENVSDLIIGDGAPYVLSVGFPLDVFDPIVKKLEVIDILRSMTTPGENEITAIDPNSKLILYSTLEDYAGTKIDSMGFSDEDLQNNSFNQVNVEGKRYYSSSTHLDNILVFLMESADSIFEGRPNVVICIVVLSAVCIGFLLILLNRHDVTSPNVDDDSDTKLEQILDRFYAFFEIDNNWSEKTADEKALIMSKTIFHALSFLIIGIVFFRNSLLDDNTVFGFIVQSRWTKGINIFSISAVIVVCFVYNFIITIIEFLFRKMSKIVSKKNETILSLIQSVITYGTMLGLLFYCLYLMGMDPASLLASAGLAGVIISMGAKDLITDILAGLFIIFENQFQVGDMIQVGPDLGSVMDIGVRTTRLQTISGDVLCIGNRNLSNVVNKTRTITRTSIMFSVSYKQDILAIEKMLREEVPKLSSISDKFIDKPSYLGILDFNERYVRMLIGYSTKEQDRFNVTCLLNTEICRLFDEYGFQLGIKPVEYKN